MFLAQQFMDLFMEVFDPLQMGVSELSGKSGLDKGFILEAMDI
jgi:hypothetical protein